ncbi:MAG: hypothetical protein HFK08_02560 [Clostridia bacterium]|jgi:hypothetical protein|nr:hypothetical protein [Clostridia bacterium]
MKKAFVAVVAIIIIMFGLSMRGDVERLSPFSVTHEGGCVRADTHISAETVVSRMGATLLWTEEFDGVTVYYCYSDFVNGYEVVCGKKVNIMIAQREEYTAVGIPLLTGSY